MNYRANTALPEPFPFCKGECVKIRFVPGAHASALSPNNALAGDAEIIAVNQNE